MRHGTSSISRGTTERIINNNAQKNIKQISKLRDNKQRIKQMNEQYEKYINLYIN